MNLDDDMPSLENIPRKRLKKGDTPPEQTAYIDLSGEPSSDDNNQEIHAPEQIDSPATEELQIETIKSMDYTTLREGNTNAYSTEIYGF